MPSVHGDESESRGCVGNVVPESLCAELDAAMDSESVFRSSKLRTVGKAKVCNVYAPIVMTARRWACRA